MKILILDDEESMNIWLKAGLKRKGYSIFTYTEPEEALKKIKNEKIDLFISDIRMPMMDGIDFLKKAKKINPDIKGILMTAFGSIEGVIEGFREGATDFLIKPFSLDELYERIKRVESKPIESVESEGEKIIFASDEMKNVLDLVDNIARTDTTVIIYGETGTGKELIAKRIHRLSHRSKGKFLTINCAALPENLLESELFGYKKGAFTGAYKDKVGLLNVANGGTFFMDEISEMPMSLQAKLLRVLQEKEITPIGGHLPEKIDVRIIVATNKNLKMMVDKNLFREDLYYRLNVIPVNIQPLRERERDIQILVEYFTEKYSRKYNMTKPNIDERAIKKFKKYNWPGNVRELENVIERMIIMGVEAGTLPLIEEATKEGNIKGIKEQEIELIKQTLERTGGNKKKTAEILGIDYSTLYRKIKKYRIEI
jgi:DNA-binding NtrC family response regulator